jgi:ABC-type branched-subunit amino acid transport system permease subunit
MAGAVAGVHYGNVQTTNFAMLEGLPYLLLAVVGGVAVVSGTIFGAATFQIFTAFLPNAWFPTSEIVKWWSRLGPGLSGVAIARQPEGVIPQVGHDVRERCRKAAGSPPAEVPSPAGVTPTIEPAPTAGS